MNSPLVSVICLCYNHAPYVIQALESVFSQTHKNIQLVVVDDGSRDESRTVIEKYLASHPDLEFIPLKENLGNCRAFNLGFKSAQGEFIIDLSADDALLPQRVERGLQAFQQTDNSWGVHFSDAEIIDQLGRGKGYHSDRIPHSSVPQGDIYCEVLSRYFINSPTMMMRREVFEKLNGYDESLAYEDFDFWVRSSRYYKYSYSPEVLVKRRMLDSSMGSKQYRVGGSQMESTFKVCQKALALNRNEKENKALERRVLYEFRQSLKFLHGSLAWKYFRLSRQIP